MMKRFGAFAAVGVAAFLLGSGASFLFAAWDNAPSSPPSGNTPAPLNVGDDVDSKRQEKIGGLIIKKDFDVGGKAKVGKGFEAGGKAKVGGALEVGAGGTFGESLVAPLLVAGPLSPAGASGATVLTVGGKIQIRGGGPVAGYVLTADSDGTASWQRALPEPTANGQVLTAESGREAWKALPPAGVTKIKGGSNVRVTPEAGTGEVTVEAVGGVTKINAGNHVWLSGGGTGEVTVNASWPDLPREVPYPPGGGKILYSNSEGSMSWGDPPSPPSAPSKSVTMFEIGDGMYPDQPTADKLCQDKGYKGADRFTQTQQLYRTAGSAVAPLQKWSGGRWVGAGVAGNTPMLLDIIEKVYCEG